MPQTCQIYVGNTDPDRNCATAAINQPFGAYHVIGRRGTVIRQVTLGPQQDLHPNQAPKGCGISALRRQNSRHRPRVFSLGHRPDFYRNKVPLDRVPALAKALNVDPAYLVRRTIEQAVGVTAAQAVIEIFGTPATGRLMELRGASDDSDPRHQVWARSKADTGARAGADGYTG